ncbi:putative lactoylglutathione lyase [Streptomonospora nanhaiensis]|uniref:Putative lactoylglutathione lyase n=1 Tax=Streptomonospora nanhaiensis TaxID=1323731 RepID=A0A853BQV1_9ACTN|nr:putative lactoylglutathione lyase [Streptomonospora nanhaiensis]
MADIENITLSVADTANAERFYSAFLGPYAPIRVRASEAATAGFRGFTLALTVAQPADVDLLVGAALDAGATALKPATKSLWGYGGVLRAPDGTVWKVATSAKRNTAPASRRIEEFVLLLGVEDVVASKRFYVGQGMAVDKSFGRTYVQFTAEEGRVKLALYRRRALAKDLGVAPEGSGSHRVVIGGSGGDFTDFTDPDGFEWEAAVAASAS